MITQKRNKLMKIPSSVVKACNLLGCKKLQSIGNFYGAFLAVFVMLIRTSASSIVHHMPKNINSIEILFIESFFGLIILSIVFAGNLNEIIRTKKPFLQLLKSIANILGTVCLFQALKYLPLGLSSTLSLSSTIFGIIGSLILFSEKPNLGIIISVILSLVGFGFISGVVVKEYSFSLLYPLVAAFFFSISTLISKEIALFDSLKTSLFCLFLYQTILTAFPAYLVFEPISFTIFVNIFLISCILLLSIPLTLQSESFAALAFLAPFKSLRVFCSSLFGFVLFQEKLPSKVFWGVICIIFSYVLIMRNNSQISSYYIKKKGGNVFGKD